MIDYISVETTYFNYNYIFQKFPFVHEIDSKSEEIKTNEYGTQVRECTWRNLTLKLIKRHNTKRLVIQGSIHKFWNQGKHNYNDFTYLNIFETIHFITEELRVDPKNLIIHNIEFGLNISHSYKIQKILSNLIGYRHKKIGMHNAKGEEFYQVKYNRILFKIYNKSLHCNLDSNIQRVELKVTRMERIVSKLFTEKTIPNYHLTLAELFNHNVYPVFFSILLKFWNNIIFIDYTIQLCNNQIDKLEYSEMKDFNVWLEMNRRTRYKKKLKLKAINAKYSENIQEKINDLLTDKFYSLMEETL